MSEKFAEDMDFTMGLDGPLHPHATPQQGGVIWTLWAEQMYMFVFIESGFLVIFPALKIVAMFLVWVIPMRPVTFVKAVKVQRFISKWAMLDVFIFGTAIFIHEANEYLKLYSLAGVTWMWFLFFFGYALDIFFAMAVNSTIDEVTQMAFILESRKAAKYDEASHQKVDFEDLQTYDRTSSAVSNEDVSFLKGV